MINADKIYKDHNKSYKIRVIRVQFALLQFPSIFLTFNSLKKSIFILATLLVFACTKKVGKPYVDETDRNAPNEVSNLMASSTSTLLELSWNDPTDKDLTQIEVFWDGNSYKIPKGNEYFAMDNPALKTYTFVVKTIDDKGNSSKGVSITNQIDYRLKYCGKFKFTQFEWFYAVGNTTYYPVSYYNGYVAIDKYSSDKLVIRYKDGSNVCTCNNDSVYGGYFKPSINNSGVFGYPEILQLSTTSALNGSFINTDSLAFLFTIETNGNISGQDVKGKRIN